MVQLTLDHQSKCKQLAEEAHFLREQLAQADAALAAKESEQRRVHLVDQPDYEDRVRALLNDMETMTRSHQRTMAAVQDKLAVAHATNDQLREQLHRQQQDTYEVL